MTDPNLESQQEGFITHLIELRDRLVKALFGVLVVGIALFIWPGPSKIYNLLAEPMIAALPAGAQMIATGVISPFMVPMKVTALLSLLIALPWVLYQAWAFVAPGLYAHEKRLIAPLVVSSSLLFASGVAFCYFFVFGRVFKFISDFAPTTIHVSPDVENYLDFVMSMCLAFGLTFEVPIVVVVLVRVGIVTVEQLRNWRSYVVVGIAVISAIVTPPDAVSMLALAVPMWLLFEAGVLIAPVFTRMTQAPDDDESESNNAGA